MLIGANGNLPQSAYADNAAEVKTASVAPVPAAAAPSAPLDKITLSAAALRLIAENNQLAQIASSASQIPPPVSSDSRKAKKRQPSASPMLDVDAFRLIRDKLRAENLEIKAPDPQNQKNKDDKDQATAVSL
ncbi:hypothetical protein [Herbaspirillum sp. NPDC101397]|uniref:hypothetical protein n=1 Tax=Herbaspirillum sp. NPDC101397 TaxID=3364006 RepID=UPI00383A9B55